MSENEAEMKYLKQVWMSCILIAAVILCQQWKESIYFKSWKSCTLITYLIKFSIKFAFFMYICHTRTVSIPYHPNDLIYYLITQEIIRLSLLPHEWYNGHVSESLFPAAYGWQNSSLLASFVLPPVNQWGSVYSLTN